MIAAGTRIGVFEITGHLGAGGMGEVYRARDTRLGRDVALKILPETFAADPDRLMRFEREARTLAALNHPHIAQVYGVEETAGANGGSTRALVMELVEGEDLSQRIARGPVPLDEALAVARQIADALEAAHERGIIHRDLKPANIKVRDDGTVKVLDFGLAKALESGVGNREWGVANTLVNSPTITSPAMTQAGIILGTAAYMSPEQAKGKPADKRSDIWAFGCVLYEMLTGTRAFGGADVAETLAAVIRAEPDMTALPAKLPPLVRAALLQCLTKNPAARLADVAAVQFALQHAEVGAAARHPERSRAIAWLAIATVAAGVGYAVASTWRRPVQTAAPIVRSSLMLGPDDVFDAPGARIVALSPDGRRLAYAANNSIYLRELDSLEAQQVRGTEGYAVIASRDPFFSPDGQWLGFWKDRALRKVSLSGGSPVLVCEIPAGVGSVATHWAADDTILFGGRGIFRVPAAGGVPTAIVSDMKGSARAPRLLPGGQQILFTFIPDAAPTRTDVVVRSLSSGEQRTIVPGASDAEYLPGGHLVYFFDGTVFAAPFDVSTLTLSGPPAPILKDVARGPFNPTAVGQFTVSRDGTFVYVPGPSVGVGVHRFVFVDRQGGEQMIPAPARPYAYPRLSPDGSRVAVHVQLEALDLWSLNLERGNPTRLTSTPVRDFFPVWSDARHLFYGSGVPPNVWRLDVDGGGSPEPVEEPIAESHLPGSVAPDGSALLMTVATSNSIASLSLDGHRKVTTLLRSARSGAVYRNPEVSPDGRWLAYQTNESGQFEVEVRPYPQVTANRYVVSTTGGTQPAWSPAGDELFYVAPEGGVMSVAVAKGAAWTASTPRRVITGDYTWSLPGISGRLYDVSRDGRRFLLLKPAGERPGTPSLVIVQNALSDLRAVQP